MGATSQPQSVAAREPSGTEVASGPVTEFRRAAGDVWVCANLGQVLPLEEIFSRPGNPEELFVSSRGGLEVSAQENEVWACRLL